MTAATGSTDLWIRRFHPVSDPLIRLACLPHAGGSASFFLPVSKTLFPHCEVLAVQYPGRQDRRHEKCIDNIPELADMVAEQLLALTDRPLAIFGHSMGATISFEVARRLERHNIIPTALFVSGRRAPSRHRDETVHLRSDDGIIAELRMLNGTESAALDNEEILRMSLPAIRADYSAAETYRYVEGPALRSPIHVHVGIDDPKVSLDEANDWSRHTTGTFDLHTYPGGHFYLKDQAAKLTEAIRLVLLPENHA